VDSIEPDADTGAVEDKAHDRLRRAKRAFKAPILEAEGVSSRMVGAPAQEEIDEPTGKFLRPQSDIVHLELLA